MLSHVVCQPTQPNGGEEVDAEAHVARSVLYASAQVSKLQQEGHGACMLLL